MELILLAWTEASVGAEGTRTLAELVWAFVEDNLAAVLLCGLLYCVFTLALAAAVVYLLLKSSRR
jgi:hypothetical protein